MTKRYLENWISSYMYLVKTTEPARRFHLWVAITIVAAMLGRKCEIEFGPVILHPNLYTILTGPPGIRKGEAIKYGESILEKVVETSGLAPAPDIITRQAFYKQLELAEHTDYDNDGKPFIHSSLLVIAPELVVFLQEKEINQRMADLCALYDGKAHLLYQTKTQGETYAVNPSVWLLAATTPNWIQISMPQLAVGGGMTSRTIFVVSMAKGAHIPFTRMPKFDPELSSKLIYDLAEIKKMIGRFTFDQEAIEYYEYWYIEAFPKHGVKDQRLLSYIERLPSMVIKVAMVISASKRDTMIVTRPDLKQSVQFFSDLHHTMPLAFGGQGLSSLGAQTNMVKELLRNRIILSESELLSTLYMHITKYDMERIKETLVGAKFCRIDIKGGEKCWFLSENEIQNTEKTVDEN